MWVVDNPLPSLATEMLQQVIMGRILVKVTYILNFYHLNFFERLCFEEIGTLLRCLLFGTTGKERARLGLMRGVAVYRQCLVLFVEQMVQ